MSGPKIPRDRQCCFWCRYLDHGIPACKRYAPHPKWLVEERAQEIAGPRYDSSERLGAFVTWPYVEPESDWCGEFVEGDLEKFTKRKPKRSDTEYDLGISEP